MSEWVKKFSAEDLSAEKLEKMGLVLVDFWATWCGPCRMLAPVIEEIAEETKGALTVGKMDIDENTQFAIGLGIASIPTLILFKDGKEVARTIGVQPKQAILSMIHGAQ